MFTPFHNLVYFTPVTVKPREGVVIVDDVKHARVVAVGPGKHLPNGAVRPTCAKVGDYIVFSHMAGGQIRDFICNGERVFYCDDQFIDGKVEETDLLGRTPAEPEKLITDTSDDIQMMKIVTN